MELHCTIKRGIGMIKRIYLIVLDSVGIGEAPDAALYGDEGSNTLRAASTSSFFNMPNMQRLGLFNIDGVDCRPSVERPIASFARMQEASKGKDTTIGHWEIAGVISNKPLPTFSEGFPDDVIEEFKRATGRGVLCNKPYSGTEVIKDFGERHMKTGDLIVYTSADSVFQIAAHEDIVPIEKLYEYCRMAREMLVGDYGVGRVIARPFTGTPGDFIRTKKRHDFSVVPPAVTMLNMLRKAELDTIAIGKINDIFAGDGISKFIYTSNNDDGINRALEYLDQDFHGLCFVNLVDFDMIYGHRNDVDGYAKALTSFDNRLPSIIDKMKEDDVLMITADHGCDPITPSTDHSREYTPWLIYGDRIKQGINLKTRPTFADIGSTVLGMFGIASSIEGSSLSTEIVIG